MAHDQASPAPRKVSRFPLLHQAAELLVMGHLLRRNVLVYKAPPNYEAYDLIAMHPDPREKGPKLRLQVKSRSASDAGQFFPMKPASLDGFDFLVYVRLNIGYFYQRARVGQPDERPPEFYTLPQTVAR